MPNKAHMVLQGAPTTVPITDTSRALETVSCEAGMKTEAMVMALIQLLGFSAWNVAAWVKDTGLGACAPLADAPLSFHARNTRYSAPEMRSTWCASG
jgi:hypothetical protein